MSRFSQLNTKPSLQVTWASDARVVLPGGFEVGPFSQLNHANLRPSGQPSPGVLTGVRALVSLSGIPAFSQLNANSSLQVTWACDVRVAWSGFDVGPFSQLNHANLRPSGQSHHGALTEVHALASLGGLLAFSQLNATLTSQVTWACDVRVAWSGFDVGPFSQLNALADWAVLGHQKGGLPAHLLPSLRTKFPVGPRGHEHLNRRPCLHVPDEPRTTRGSVRLEPKILRRSMN